MNEIVMDCACCGSRGQLNVAAPTSVGTDRNITLTVKLGSAPAFTRVTPFILPFNTATVFTLTVADPLRVFREWVLRLFTDAPPFEPHYETFRSTGLSVTDTAPISSTPRDPTVITYADVYFGGVFYNTEQSCTDGLNQCSEYLTRIAPDVTRTTPAGSVYVRWEENDPFGGIAAANNNAHGAACGAAHAALVVTDYWGFKQFAGNAGGYLYSANDAGQPRIISQRFMTALASAGGYIQNNAAWRATEDYTVGRIVLSANSAWLCTADVPANATRPENDPTHWYQYVRADLVVPKSADCTRRFLTAYETIRRYNLVFKTKPNPAQADALRDFTPSTFGGNWKWGDGTDGFGNVLAGHLRGSRYEAGSASAPGETLNTGGDSAPSFYRCIKSFERGTDPYPGSDGSGEFWQFIGAPPVIVDPLWEFVRAEADIQSSARTRSIDTNGVQSMQYETGSVSSDFAPYNYADFLVWLKVAGDEVEYHIVGSSPNPTPLYFNARYQWQESVLGVVAMKQELTSENSPPP
jgi:hypothetical protein